MILENLVLVISLIAIGSLIKKTSWFPKNTADVLNSFVLNISLPAIILVSIPSLKMNSEIAYPVLIHWFALSVHLVLIFIAYKLFNLSKSVLGALIIVSTLGNTAFVGIPMSKGFFGMEAVPFAVLYDQLGSGIGFIIYGAFILPLFTATKKQTVADVYKMLITFPAFIALVLGFALSFAPPLPSLISGTLNQLAATLIPCAMIAVGFSMNYRLPKSTLSPLAIGLVLKLVLLPFIVLGVVKGIGLKGIATETSVLQSGMSPMITAGAMATSAKLEEELSVALVGFGLIFSFATLAALKYFL